MSWRVNREAAVLLGGGRALILQVAHPLVAAGVAAHSRFRTEPLVRLRRTLDLMLRVIFASAADALEAVRQIEAVHTHVHGSLDQPVGPYPRGTPYDASDPRLLLWVHATLIGSALATYERFVAPLAPADRAAYYDESKIAARLFAIPTEMVPATLADFDAYIEARLADDLRAIGSLSRDLAATLLRPPVPLVAAPAFRASAFVTLGLLPPTLRARFELPWTQTQEQRLTRLASASRRLVPRLPRLVRLLPQARRAGA